MKNLTRTKYRLSALAALLVCLATCAFLRAEEPIDVERGRALMQKWQQGDPLTPEETVYLERVRQEIQRRSLAKQTAQPRPAPEAPRVLTDWSSLVPLTDLTGTYKGQDGGLYRGEGATTRPRRIAPPG